MAKINAPVYKNQELEGEVIDLTYQGMGVVKVEDYPIFVVDAVPGEVVKLGVTKVQKNFAFGRVIKRIRESDERNHEVNQAALTTGIAPLANLTYDAQLKFKQNQIQELFKKMHITATIEPTIGMENPIGYRNKAQVPVRKVRGQLTTGFYRRNSHQLVPIEDYYIQDPAIDAAIIVVRDLMRHYQLDAYDEETHTGDIRTIMVRRGYYSHEMMVVIVTRRNKLPVAEMLVEGIKKALPEVTSIIQNVNSEKTNLIMGSKNKTLWGADYITDTLWGKTFEIGPMSFYQVNPQTTEKLYSMAVEKAGLTGEELVIDAYSGIGTISLSVAAKARRVVGVEIVQDAVEDAKRNAKINGIENVEFELGKAEDKMVEWQAAELQPDVIFVDPPRKGLTPELIDAATGMQPTKIVYISCNPATLARDAEHLLANGYQIDGSVQPIDQFPQTTHIETVTVFIKA
ncbi:23S rRNA (uracil(1939)-C(5))-methyltransferase RlmD [Weissella koreensis]|uniref:23S rRNA (Uracil(1939)-C(5))-methyltransferase RlmD n=1 Tax=Weissella koreensis TaxID=165096 RepID=A0A7H1MKQ9_9LACO|nr:23S rRNA (uracil(1939)-C(5))-methyltransferase RlmD [Weissella koreensis]AVH74842.1 23S rRNA (uracil(1939)-C(5))-methyltransferase RlmD [Weissella koreensis]EJF33799.1 TrmA family tRNA (uracil-5-)-methyltransferase [Weissella koreensis KCTC 3621]QGN20066.1 23S rRNA (uracil(1939)-C(5))-methyltransferase RlmD [Weissella koreensis]QNT64045.1 23S rRNA (uracil(1939)-C(5))-methyltransferase RlmD [Weissella koreensis]